MILKFNLWLVFSTPQLLTHDSSLHSHYYTLDLQAEIVEMTFVVSRFSDIRKETTSFLVVPKKQTRNDARLVSDLKNNQPALASQLPNIKNFFSAVFLSFLVKSSENKKKASNRGKVFQAKQSWLKYTTLTSVWVQPSQVLTSHLVY